jgi:CxxC motif-containing protein (DUF1111 family)
MKARALLFLLIAPLATVPSAVAASSEAPAGFGNATNGMITQGQFDLDLATFESREGIADGLGPVYNAQSCAECHQNSVTGGNSQVSVIRVGRYDGKLYQDRPGGSLIQDRAIDPALQEKVSNLDNVRTFRMSLSILGDGYVEAVADSTFEMIRAGQPPAMKGTIIRVPVLEAPGTTRIGRFGWKNQHASLLSFSADAYLNEMGITSPLQPAENTANGVSVAAYDTVPDPEEPATASEPFGEDVEIFARFMRSTQVPAPDAALAQTAAAQSGLQVFRQIGCHNCHTQTLTTAPAGTVLNGGTLVVPPSLGDKVFHPYSDFMLHDVGTGDGIVQNGGPQTRTMLRTPPLWGLRTRSRLMHDGASLTRYDAILRHDREARSVVQAYLRLNQQQRDSLMAFLGSL